MQQYIDAHCHLPKTENFSDVFINAQNNGIVGCVLNSVNESDWQQIIKIASENKNIRGCIGIHPWNTDSVSTLWQSNMIAVLQDNPKLLIGEIGLDKTRDNFAIQEKIFISQLEIAIQYKRTINLHCVHAWDVMLNILKMYRLDLPQVVVHAFDGTQNVINFAENLYFSYSPNIINNKYKKVVESVLKIPKNRILVESDSFDLIPTITAACGVQNLRPDVTANDIYNNSKRVFFNG